MPNAREERCERLAQTRSSVVGVVFMFDNHPSDGSWSNVASILSEGNITYNPERLPVSED